MGASVIPDGRNAGGGNANDAIRGGLAPENWPAVAAVPQGAAAVVHQTWYKMINSTTTNGDTNYNHYWIAFQPTYNAMNRINAVGTAQGKKVAWNAKANPQAAGFLGVDAAAALCGAIRTATHGPTNTPNCIFGMHHLNL